MNQQQVLAIIQQCIDACAEHEYQAPYDVTISTEHVVRLGWRVDREGSHSLPGDIGAAGEIKIGSQFMIGITDANLRHADFRVDRWELVDGTPLPPTIAQPPGWDCA